MPALPAGMEAGTRWPGVLARPSTGVLLPADIRRHAGSGRMEAAARGGSGEIGMAAPVSPCLGAQSRSAAGWR